MPYCDNFRLKTVGVCTRNAIKILRFKVRAKNAANIIRSENVKIHLILLSRLPKWRSPIRDSEPPETDYQLINKSLDNLIKNQVIHSDCALYSDCIQVPILHVSHQTTQYSPSAQSPTQGITLQMCLSGRRNHHLSQQQARARHAQCQR